jgi:signal transduction histidine kinase
MNNKVESAGPVKLVTSVQQNIESRQFIFKPLSIQQRLPLFICILLTTIIVLFSWFSYLGVKDAGMANGSERVTTLVDKLSVMFKGSVDHFAASTAQVAQKPAIKEYLISGSKKSHLKALTIFREFLKKDTTNKLIELLNEQKHVVLSIGNHRLPVRSDTLWTKAVSQHKNYKGVGRIIMLDDEMYFPVLSSVVEKGKVLGYVVNWKHLYAKQESIDQFGQLLGSNGKLYFGNDDGLFWTDLRKAIPKPPVDLSQLQNVTIYSREKGNPLLGSVRKIANSRWLILVELSSSSFQRTANSFLQRVTIIGTLLILAGSLWAWLISRRITKPLQQLGSAASAIADGNYSLLVHINRNDELGTLAKSFNIMAVRVRAAQESMEQKVEETSKELLTAITDIQDQKESEKKKDEFISIASHELKTPLTTIKAFFQLAAKEMPADSRPFQLIGKASRQLSRMERLIGDLLDVSKINAGKMYYNLEEFDFREILKEATDSVQEIYPDHTLIVEKTVPVRLLADRHRVEQVIVNLLTNAVKYSPGKDQVVIRSELEGSMLLVSIQDFGIGIEEKHLSELFGRFYRVNIDHRFQGLGLGLFISAEIIKRHGGDISVKSELGKGSIFAFRIPVAIAT